MGAGPGPPAPRRAIGPGPGYQMGDPIPGLTVMGIRAGPRALEGRVTPESEWHPGPRPEASKGPTLKAAGARRGETAGGGDSGRGEGGVK